ncbi:MAG TPA: hypothetical protein VG105_09710 [Paraburkholderia sp.]|jgi:hypothetical protein|nr:hypothetical protein [Paraburkholderia sp.]
MNPLLRRLVVSSLIVGTLNLQGCATSAETFALGGLVGALASVSAMVCSAGCR